MATTGAGTFMVGVRLGVVVLLAAISWVTVGVRVGEGVIVVMRF